MHGVSGSLERSCGVVALSRLAWFLLLLSPALFGVNMLAARYATFVPPNALALGAGCWSRSCCCRSSGCGRGPMPLRSAANGPIIRCSARSACGSRGALRLYRRPHEHALNIGLIYAASPILVVLLGPRARQRAAERRHASRASCSASPASPRSSRAAGSRTCSRCSSAPAISGSPRARRAGPRFGAAAPSSEPLRSTHPALPVLAGGSLILLPSTVGEAILWGPPDLGDPRVWLAWLVIALVPGIGAYAAYAFCVVELGPSRTSLAMHLVPAHVAVMAWAALASGRN